MANPVQTSLEQEFNRLNFLASIATRTTDIDHNTIKSDSVKLTQVTTMAPSVASSANGLHFKDHKSTVNTPVNGLASKISLGTSSNIGKINSLLINPSNQPSFQLKNNNSSLRMVAKSGPAQVYSTRGPRNVSQIRPQIQPTHATTSNILLKNHVNVSPLKNANKSQGIIQKGNSNISIQSSGIGSTQALTEEQKRIILSGVNILQNSSSTTTVVTTAQNLSTPLILSQSQPSIINSQTRIIAQTPVSSTTGQTILLPANFAGMSGKVFIMSNPGKGPQAIALTTSSSKVGLQQQTVVSSQNFTASNTIGNSKKPVVLVPNTTKTDKQTNSIAFSQLNHQGLAGLQPQQTVNHTLQLLATANNSSPQLKIQGQPVSMASFQNIRPKAILNTGRNIQPKTTPLITKNDTANHDVRLSHFPTASSFNNKQQQQQQQQTSVAISLVSVSIPQTMKTSNAVSILNKKSGQVPTHSNQVLMSQFDKTMSQHLQTLEKTDPYLFVQNGNKLVINQTQRPLSLLDKGNLGHQQIQDILPKQQLKGSPLKQTNVQLPQIPSNSKQQTSKSQFSVTQQIAMATQQITSSSPVINATPQQLLTMPLKQQSNLQNIIKQQLIQQQQQQQLLQNKGLTGKIQIVQPVQQSSMSDQLQQQLQLQQQQLKANQQGSSQPQLFLMQQKIVQPRQQKTHMVNSPLTSQQQQQILQTQQHLKNSQSIANAQPLKLLSTLTSNMVKSTGNIVQPTSLDAHLSQGIRPILVQLPGGTHMLQTTQLTSSQLLELQKHIVANSSSPNKRIQQNVQSIMPQNQVRLSVPSTISTSASSSSISSAARIAIHNFQNPSVSSLNKSAFASQASLKLKQQTTSQFITQTKYAPSFKDSQILSKSLQEHLKNLSPAQCELFLKQYASGKLTLGKQNVGSTTLLASILKKKQQEATKSAIAASQSMLGSPMQKKLDSNKSVTRPVKRAVELQKKESEEHPFSKRWKGHLQTDQMKYVSPDYKLAFSSRKDALERLIPYHISQEQANESTKDQKHEFLYQAYARNIQERRYQMVEKFNLLMLKEAQTLVPTCEDILIGRLYVSSEKETFQQQKEAVADGRAIIVRNKQNGELECVEMTKKEEQDDSSVSINLTDGQRQLDNRFLIARKDISTVDSELNDEGEEEEEEDDVGDVGFNDFDDDDDDVGVYGYHDDPVEEIEVEEVSKMDFIRDESEVAAATSNLLADLEESEDFLLDF